MTTVQKTSFAAIRRSVTIGAVYNVTNHYITHRNHTFYGTSCREVINTYDRAFFLSSPKNDGTYTRVAWPRSPQVTMDEFGVIRIYGGGKHQKDDELFLTLAPATV
jgi:hypothetical protein